jgi:3',5'-cyclic AMP phosphodiesterase CpdA
MRTPRRPADDGPVNSVQVFDGGAVLMCDSSIPGSDEGALAEETYAWIEATLDELDGSLPALLAFHHPPVALHHPLPDSYQLQGPGRLAELLERRPEIAGLVTGHAHARGDRVRRAAAGRRAGGDLDAAAALGGRAGRGPGRAGRSGLSCAGRRRAAHHALPGGHMNTGRGRRVHLTRVHVTTPGTAVNCW